MVPSRSYTIRQCLMAFGTALVLPGLVFAAILLPLGSLGGVPIVEALMRAGI